MSTRNLARLTAILLMIAMLAMAIAVSPASAARDPLAPATLTTCAGTFC